MITTINYAGTLEQNITKNKKRKVKKVSDSQSQDDPFRRYVQGIRSHGSALRGDGTRLRLREVVEDVQAGEHCDAINRLTAFFIIPLYNLHFISTVDPYAMNFRFLIGDVVAKSIAITGLALWANLSRNGDLSWAITSYSLSTLNNVLVLGIPMLEAMYGSAGKDLVLQSSVMQFLVWFPILLFMMEFRVAIGADVKQVVCDETVEKVEVDGIEIVVEDGKNGEEEDHKVVIVNVATTEQPPSSSSYNLGSVLMKVLIKLCKNPNVFGCVLALVWALVAKRWDLKMPSIVEGSIMIMAKAGSGISMFTVGLFMAQQEKIISCGMPLTLYALFMRFGIGALTTAVGSLALGLRSNALRVAIIQAALPQAITSFVFAKEYKLHPEVLSTAFFVGTIISLPLLAGYYAVLDVIH